MTNGIRKEWGEPGHTSPVIDKMVRLDEFARLIRADWRPISPYAAPYVSAMATMATIEDKYIKDSGASIVAYFLANAQTWRGPIARNVKARLNKLLSARSRAKEVK